MPNRFFGFTGRPSPFAFIPQGYTLQGHDGNQTSVGSFKRLTGEIAFFHAFRLEGVYWDIANTQTYDLQLVDSVAASPKVIRLLSSNLSLTGGNVKNYIPIFPHAYFTPGNWYLSLVCASAITQRRQGTNVVKFDSFMYTSIGYDGGSTTTGSIPVKLEGQYWIGKRTATP